jgi:formate dehydrogenase major subunit
LILFHCQGYVVSRPDLIKSVARIYAKAKSSIIFWGMGISQHIHGTQNAFSLINLALITGHVGK